MPGTERCALVIPKQPKTEIAVGFNLEIRRQLAELDDLDAVDEGRRRLAAWHAYVTKREQRKELQAASRWCEIRIGELLGNGEHGGDRKSIKSPASNLIDSGKDDRHKFRLLAKHKKLVAKLIEGGQVSRQQLLAAIRESGRVAPPTTEARTSISLEDCGGPFGCIYADPPWMYGNQSTRAATNNHYSTLSVDDLCEWPVSEVAAPDAHLHLWTTNAFLPDSFRLIEAWGFEYRSCFVWVKPQMGIGNYWRVSHEFLLLGIRGNAKRFRSRSLKSWGEHPRGRHSSKPEEIRNLVEKASPGPYLELFGRKPVEGWTVMGNQIEERLFA